MGQTKGFEDFARTGQIRYPVHVTTRTASMFWGTLWIPVFAILITYLKDGPLALGVVGGLALTLIYYVACLIIANLFGRCNGYLVGSVDVHRSKVVLNTLTPLGFSLGRSVKLEMQGFAGIRLKMDLDEKGFDDFIVILAHANGGDDVRLGEIDINGKGFVRKSRQKTKFVGKHELASLAMRQLAADLNLRIENPAMLADDDPAPRVPVDPTPQPAVASSPRPAEDDHENYNF